MSNNVNNHLAATKNVDSETHQTHTHTHTHTAHIHFFHAATAHKTTEAHRIVNRVVDAVGARLATIEPHVGGRHAEMLQKRREIAPRAQRIHLRHATAGKEERRRRTTGVKGEGARGGKRGQEGVDKRRSVASSDQCKQLGNYTGAWSHRLSAINPNAERERGETHMRAERGATVGALVRQPVVVESAAGWVAHVPRRVADQVGQRW